MSVDITKKEFWSLIVIVSCAIIAAFADGFIAGHIWTCWKYPDGIKVEDRAK